MGNESSISILQTKKGTLPRVPFLLVKNAILGKEYDLSIASVTKAKSQKLNGSLRGKDYPTNVLSFPLSKNSGEIIFQMDIVKRDAPNFDMPLKKFFLYLLIHASLHLKGFEHSSIMEKEERKFLKKFS
jgi:probable rRNA maturation factor